jgi:predicted permease
MSKLSLKTEGERHVVVTRRFAADRGIIGKTISLSGDPFVVIGVMAPNFDPSEFLDAPDVWTAFQIDPNTVDQAHFFRAAARLKPGVTLAQAKAQIALSAAEFKQKFPNGLGPTGGFSVDPIQKVFVRNAQSLIKVLLAAVAGVLLIACANVATLLLSRAATRRREIAVRLSLGAPRIRLVRMLVTESLLLATLAGAASTWLLYHVPQPLYRYLAPTGPQIALPPDWRVFGYVAIVVFFTGIFSGLAPALESIKVDLAASMKGAGGMAGAAGGGTRVRGWLVTAQVAMSMLLLVQAALLGQSENRTLNADPGYQPRQIVVAPIRLPDAMPHAAALARLRHLADYMRTVPGVRGVTFSDYVPMIVHDTLELRPPSRPDAIQPVDIHSASAGYMAAIGVPLLRGRDFVESDRDAVIVSDSLGKAFFRRQDPLGKAIRFPNSVVTIVGITRDIETMRFGGSDNPIIWKNGLTSPNSCFMAVRFSSSALASGPTVRSALHVADPNLIVIARNLQSWIDLVTEPLWNVVSLILILGLVATVLATTGIYGAVSYAVSQRMRDLGIRVALGAQRRDIVQEVLVMGGKPVVRGLLMGLWLSVAMAAALHENLKGTALRVDSSNPLVYGAALGLLTLAALVAMIAPAHRGSQSDPLEALRCD